MKKRIKYIPFKLILIEGITNDYIYIRTLNKAISDQLSITDWEYPVFNDSYNHLIFIISEIWTILHTSFSFFKLHITNENNYKILLDYISNGILEKPKYYKILKFYGSFEKNVSDSRFAFYLLALIISLFFYIKRIYYGGFGKHSYLITYYILSIIFIILNVIYMILTFLLILFSGMCHVNFGYLNKDDYLVRTKILTHCIINSFCIIYFIMVLVESVKIKNYLNKIIKDLGQLSKKETYNKEYQYEYIDLNNNNIILKELKIENFPRILFYKITNDNNMENKNDIQKEGKIVNNEINNINENNINTNEKFDVNADITRNPDNPIEYNNINIDDQIKSSKDEIIKNNNKI